MIEVASCPYCSGIHFDTEVIRADDVNLEDPDLYNEIEGDWFNRCTDCGSWSIFKWGKLLQIKDKKTRPIRRSRSAKNRSAEERRYAVWSKRKK